MRRAQRVGAGAVVDLFGRGGVAAVDTLAGGPMRPLASECAQLPTVRLDSRREGWRVAVTRGRATAIPLDSLDDMSPVDSASLVDGMLALLDSLPAARDSTFRGIRFVVPTGYRFSVAGVDVIAGTARRGIPSEADPREEALFIVAERPGGSSVPYRAAYVRRTAGRSGDVPVTDVLAALVLRSTARPVLIVSNEGDEGGKFGLLERLAPARWRLTWTSAYVGC